MLVAGVLGVLLTLFALVGFFSKGSLFGFGLNTFQNVIYLIIGLSLVYAAFSITEVSLYNKWSGTFFVAFGLLGFIFPVFISGLFHTNAPSSFLHLVLGIILSGSGFAFKE